MTGVDEVKKKFATIEWYKQGAAVRPLYIGYPWQTCVDFTLRGVPISLNYFPVSGYLQDDLLDGYFPKHRMAAVARLYYGRQQRDRLFIQKLKQRWEKVSVVPFMHVVRNIEQRDLSKLSNVQLLSLLRKFSRVYRRLWREAIFLDAFDVMSEVILKRAIKKEGRAIDDGNFAVLTAPTTLSWLQKERKALFACVHLPAAKWESALKRHAARFHWIYNDYAIIRELDWKFFSGELRKLRKDPKRMRQERRVFAAVARMKVRKMKIARRLKLSRELMNTVDFLVTLAQWRDVRKALNQMGSGVLYRFVKELQRRTGFMQDDIEYLWWWEVPKLFSRSDTLRLMVRRRRRKGVFIVGDPQKPAGMFEGQDARTLQECMHHILGSVQELKGRSVFAGVVRGIVKIVRSQKEFYKMRKGDILVASNTRPEYVPIMKIAGAIVSEEGGLTCHTAIVSRELKIPAIVGVQGAIAALKDGDRVEVDAIKGIVKKV